METETGFVSVGAGEASESLREFLKTLPGFAEFLEKPSVGSLGEISEEERETFYERERERALRSDRLDRFKRSCDPLFLKKIDVNLLRNPAAYARVFEWDGSSPGRLLVGATGTAKTRSAWSVLGRLFVNEGKAFSFLTAGDLVSEIVRIRKRGGRFGEFAGAHRHSEIFFIDELEKFTLAFDSETAAVFEFYDWVYRREIACITTTNKGRDWWGQLMGDAFVRRLFDEVHEVVEF